MRTQIWITAAVALLLTGCTDVDETNRVLKSQGYTGINITGHEFFSCSSDDFSSTGFSATNAAGRQVSGVMCCGMFFKSCTVRW